jgi:hypothetical protein
MFAKIKPAFFTDHLTIEWDKPTLNPLTFILKNDEGIVCSTLQTKQAQQLFSWKGLNDLPYGRYTLECTDAENEDCVSLVKRV